MSHPRNVTRIEISTQLFVVLLHYIDRRVGNCASQHLRGNRATWLTTIYDARRCTRGCK